MKTRTTGCKLACNHEFVGRPQFAAAVRRTRCKDNTPYAKEIANCFSKNSPIREVAIMKGVQLGFTTAIFENKGWILEKSKLALRL